MQQKPFKSFSKTIHSAFLWGLIFFGVFGVGLMAYAIGFPETQPGPASGVVGLYVGSTPNVYNGGVGDYEAANAQCESEFEYSHVCTPIEMINTYNHEPGILNGENGRFWLNEGAPSGIEFSTSDCQGWTTKDSGVFGYVWDAAQKRGFMTSCDLERAYACCK